MKSCLVSATKLIIRPNPWAGYLDPSIGIEAARAADSINKSLARMRKDSFVFYNDESAWEETFEDEQSVWQTAKSLVESQPEPIRHALEIESVVYTLGTVENGVLRCIYCGIGRSMAAEPCHCCRHPMINGYQHEIL